jgi:4-amino-4-deoxy-L-arabinose transferase-like glycosyltransferase
MEGPAAIPSVRGEEGRLAAARWLRFQPEAQPATRETQPPLSRWLELALLALLVLLAAGGRAWLIRHTEVAARDSVGFIRYAIELEQGPWKEMLKRNLQHPGYPVVLLAVSWPVRQLMGGTTASSMQLSAQVTSALAGVLLIFPMYYLGRDLFGRRAAFWGTALFQCLPVSARVMSDGLSEATFLLLATTALLFAVRGLRNHRVASFAACGFFSGLAYLTRPEGALIVPATALVLGALQFVPTGRRPWRCVFACLAALLLTAAAVASPYVLVNGRLTNKPTPRRLWETKEDEAPIGRHGAHGPLTASVLAIYAPPTLEDRRLWGVYAIATEVTKDFHYLAVLPFLIGLWSLRKQLLTKCGAWVVLVLCSLHVLVLWRVAVVVGYVSDRHVLVLVVCGVFIAADGVFILAEMLTVLARRPRSGPDIQPLRIAESGKLSVVLLLVLLGFGLQEALKPLHANRAGHRQAGLWLAEHTSPADPIVDPFCWAHYYAGRVFWEGLTPPAPTGHVPTQYVVLEKSPTSEHSRLPTIHYARALAARGQVVYHWPGEKPEAAAKILVYAVRP